MLKKKALSIITTDSAKQSLSNIKTLQLVHRAKSIPLDKIHRNEILLAVLDLLLDDLLRVLRRPLRLRRDAEEKVLVLLERRGVVEAGAAVGVGAREGADADLGATLHDDGDAERLGVDFLATAGDGRRLFRKRVVVNARDDVVGVFATLLDIVPNAEVILARVRVESSVGGEGTVGAIIGVIIIIAVVVVIIIIIR